MAQGQGNIWLGHHYSAFGAACSEPTNVTTRLGWAGSVPKMLYSSLAPSDLDWNGKGCAGSNSRLRDNAVEEFARRQLTVLNADRNITHANFWNQLKGYDFWTSAGRDVFYQHYIRWATVIKAARPDVKLGGPYTSGGMGNTNLLAIHNGFITNVVEPHPGLVDFIVSGDSSTARDTYWYTDIYTSRGVHLPHWQPETYPCGHGASSCSVSAMAHDLLTRATNPLMQGAMIWGSGTDNHLAFDLWNSNGTTAYWDAFLKIADFTAVGGVTKLDSDRYRNAAGEVLSVSGL